MKNRIYLLSILVLFAIAGTVDSHAQVTPPVAQPAETALPSASVAKIKDMILKQRGMAVMHMHLIPAPMFKYRIEAIDAVLLVIEQEQLRLDEEAARARGVAIPDEEFVVEFPEVTVTASRKELLP